MLACFKRHKLIQAAAGEQQLQQPSATMQPPLDRGGRHAQGVGDPAHAPAFEVVEPQDGGVLGRQLQEGGSDRLPLGSADQLVERAAERRVVPSIQERLELDGVGRTAAGVPRADAAGAAAGDDVQPVTELLRVLKLGQGAVGLQEGILRHVFGAVAGTGRLLGHGDHRAAEAADQLVEGDGVSAPSVHDQLFIAGVRDV